MHREALSKCQLFFGGRSTNSQQPTAQSSNHHSFSNIPLASQPTSATKMHLQQLKPKNQLFDLLATTMSGREDPGSKFSIMNSKRIDQTDTQDYTNTLAHFQKKIPTFSNEHQVDRTVLLRYKKLQGLEVNDQREAKLAIKRKAVVNRTQSVLSSVNAGQSNTKVQTLPETPPESCDQGPLSKSPYIYLFVFDRVYFPNSHIISWGVYPKPKDVSERLTKDAEYTNVLTQMQAKFGLNHRYSILLTHQGEEISNFQQVAKQDVLFLSKLLLKLANDFSLKEYLRRCSNFGIQSTPSPFGIPRRKIELLFYKMHSLGNSLFDLPKADIAITSEGKKVNLKQTPKQVRTDTLVVERVLGILDHGRDALTAKDLEDLCTFEKYIWFDKRNT
jgi:hypothetical protein